MTACVSCCSFLCTASSLLDLASLARRLPFDCLHATFARYFPGSAGRSLHESLESGCNSLMLVFISKEASAFKEVISEVLAYAV